MSDTAITAPEPAWAGFIGLDWGSQKHAWILEPAGRGKREQGVVDNTPEAIAVWVADLHRRFAGQPVAVALEQKRGSVVNLLLPYAHLVLFPVPASMSASCRKTFVPSGAKDDPSDASRFAVLPAAEQNANPLEGQGVGDRRRLQQTFREKLLTHQLRRLCVEVFCSSNTACLTPT